MRIKDLWFHQKTVGPKEKAQAILDTFQRVAHTPDGLIALSVILEDLYAFRVADTDEAKHLKNYATFFIRERLGATDALAMTEAIITTTEER